MKERFLLLGINWPKVRGRLVLNSISGAKLIILETYLERLPGESRQFCFFHFGLHDIPSIRDSK